MESKHTREQLKYLQSLPLERKIKIAQTRIFEFYERNGGQVYISFSGGKDSTVLLDIARKMYPDIEAIFCNTGLEYPEIVQFVDSIPNVREIHPTRGFKGITQAFGYPVISKEIAEGINSARNNINCARSRIMHGTYEKAKSERYKTKSKWCYLIDDAPFKISAYCCNVMKKQPFNKIKDKKPIIGTMADESELRRTQWLKYGCNSFEGKIASKPLSIWTTQDILQYIKIYNLTIPSIYGDIIEDEKGKLSLTGLRRTGCMYCMFGVHLEKSPNRFQLMKKTHPEQYIYAMKPVSLGGLGIADILDYLGVAYE